MIFADSAEAMRDAALALKARRRPPAPHRGGGPRQGAPRVQRADRRALHRGSAFPQSLFAGLRMADDAVVKRGPHRRRAAAARDVRPAKIRRGRALRARFRALFPLRRRHRHSRRGGLRVSRRPLSPLDGLAALVAARSRRLCGGGRRRRRPTMRCWRSRIAPISSPRSVAACRDMKLTLHLHNDPQTMDGSRSSQRTRAAARNLRRDLLRQRFHPRPISRGDRGRRRQDVDDPQWRRRFRSSIPAKAPMIAFTGRVAADQGRRRTCARLRGRGLARLAAGDRGRRSRGIAGGDSAALASIASAKSRMMRRWLCSRARKSPRFPRCGTIPVRARRSRRWPRVARWSRAGAADCRRSPARRRCSSIPADTAAFAAALAPAGVGRSTFAARHANARARASRGETRNRRRDGAARRRAGAAARVNALFGRAPYVTRSSRDQGGV